MDFMMQFIRKDRRPFGGVQVLFIGDLLQLPPVVKQEEWEVLKHYYTGMYFFQSQVITQHPLLYIELDKNIPPNRWSVHFYTQSPEGQQTHPRRFATIGFTRATRVC